MKFAHVSIPDGKIMQVTEMSVPFERDGHSLVILDEDQEVPDFSQRKYTLRIFQNDCPECRARGEFVALPPDPPEIWKVKEARNAELLATDAYMVPDRPLSDAERDQWKEYRQTLRNLGGYESSQEMIVTWPLRPNGVDALPPKLRNWNNG